MMNLNDLRLFKYDDGFTPFEALLQSSKCSSIDDYFGIINHTEFEPYMDTNQPMEPESVVPFYFSHYLNTGNREPHICFFNLLAMTGLKETRPTCKQNDN